MLVCRYSRLVRVLVSHRSCQALPRMASHMVTTTDRVAAAITNITRVSPARCHTSIARCTFWRGTATTRKGIQKVLEHDSRNKQAATSERAPWGQNTPGQRASAWTHLTDRIKEDEACVVELRRPDVGSTRPLRLDHWRLGLFARSGASPPSLHGARDAIWDNVWRTVRRTLWPRLRNCR